jgi:F0F1-type ATP synthase delta subunit
VKVNLPDSIHSPEQLEALLFDLDAYSGYRRRLQRKAKAAATVTPQDSWSPQLENLLGTPEQAAARPLKDIEAIYADLSAWRQAPVVHLTLPVRPPQTLRLELVHWLRQNITDQLLVKISINAEVVGGMVLRTPARIHDWSFRRRLSEQADLLAERLHAQTSADSTSPPPKATKAAHV